jgi:O-glycosyl hydrolase
MKTNNDMRGGGIVNTQYSAYASYLSKAVEAFKSELSHTPYAVAIQNEPQNPDGSYPTCTMSVDDMGQIGTALRTQLDNGGLNEVKIIGYEHNWVCCGVVEPRADDDERII